MAVNSRHISLQGRSVLEETILPAATSDPVSFFNPEGGVNIEVVYGTGQSGSAVAVIQHCFADAPTTASDWHNWTEGTVSGYTVSRINAIRGSVRCVSSSATVSWRVSL